jgi:hypothetical protein
MSDNKSNNALAAIVERAKNDPAFFHALVFQPEDALKELRDVDRRIKGTIIGANPERIVELVASGTVSWCDVTCTSSCGVTCSGGSCGHTTNLELNNRYINRLSGKVSWCDVTCTSSCGATCNQSCGHTTNLEFDAPVRRFF